MAAISPKKKAFAKTKSKSKVHSKVKAQVKSTPAKKQKVVKKPEIEVPQTAAESALKLMGLPFTVKDEAIRKWFKDIGVTLEELHRCDSPCWRSGMAYATVASDDLLKKGLKKDKQKLEGRYINVVIKAKKEMKSVMGCVAILDNVVRLRGIPYKCKKNDITEFFEGLSICPNGIYINKKNKGQAYVRFKDADTAKEARKKNDSDMGDRYVKVYMCKLPQLTELKYHMFRSEKHGIDKVNKFFGTDSDTKSPAKKTTQKPVSKVSKKDDDALPEDSDEEMWEEVEEEEEAVEVEGEDDEEAEDEEDDDEEAEEEEDGEEAEGEEDEVASEEDEEISMGEESDESMEEGIKIEEMKIFEGGNFNADWCEAIRDELNADSGSSGDDSDSEWSLPEPAPKKKKSGGSKKEDLSSKGFKVKKDKPGFTEFVKSSSDAKKNGGSKRTSMAKAKDSDEETVPQLVAITPKQKATPLPKRLSTAKKGKRRSMFTETPK